MSIAVIKTKTDNQIFSPFSGEPAETENGPNINDATLLFVHYGMTGDFAYLSDSVKAGFIGQSEEPELEDVLAAIGIEGAIAIEVDADWNGVNMYGFAPISS